MSINTPAPAGQPPDRSPAAGHRSRRCPRLRPPPARGRRHLPRHRRRRRPGPRHGPRPGLRPPPRHSLHRHRPAHGHQRALPRARLDAGGTRLRLRALHVMGHGSARIARAAGVREMTIRALVRGDARTISPQLRDTIADLYDAWWDKRAPGRTRAERGAATAARKRAIAGNWCAAAALDDDQLDIPGYRPQHGLETRHRHRHRPRHPPARPPPPEEPHMTSDDRMTWTSSIEVLDVLERHGYHQSDNQHTGQASRRDPRPRPRLRRHPRRPLRHLPRPGPALAAPRARTTGPASRSRRRHPHRPPRSEPSWPR